MVATGDEDKRATRENGHGRSLFDRAWSSARDIGALARDMESELHLLDKSRSAVRALGGKALQVADYSGVLQHVAAGLGWRRADEDAAPHRREAHWKALEVLPGGGWTAGWSAFRRSGTAGVLPERSVVDAALKGGPEDANSSARQGDAGTSQVTDATPVADHRGDGGRCAFLDLLLTELLANLFRTTPAETLRWTRRIEGRMARTASHSRDISWLDGEAAAIALLLGTLSIRKPLSAMDRRFLVRTLLPLWMSGGDAPRVLERCWSILQGMASCAPDTRFYEPRSRSPSSLGPVQRSIVDAATVLLLLVRRVEDWQRGVLLSTTSALDSAVVTLESCGAAIEDALESLLTLIEQNRHETDDESRGDEAWLNLADLCALADTFLERCLSESLTEGFDEDGAEFAESGLWPGRWFRESLRERLANILFQSLTQPGVPLDVEDLQLAQTLASVDSSKALSLQQGLLLGLEDLPQQEIIRLACRALDALGTPAGQGRQYRTCHPSSPDSASGHSRHGQPGWREAGEAVVLEPSAKALLELALLHFGLPWRDCFAACISDGTWQEPLGLLLWVETEPLSGKEKAAGMGCAREESLGEEILFAVFAKLLFTSGRR